MTNAQLEIFELWRKQYKPAGLLENDHNAEVIGAAIRDNFGGRVSIPNLNEVIQQLGSKLQYRQAPQQPQFVEKIVEKIVYREPVQPVKSAKQIAQEKRDAAIHAGVRVYGSDRTELDRVSAKTLVEDETFNNNVRAANQLAARHNIDRLIQNYSVNSPSGRVDHTRTHQRREELRKIKVTLENGEIDYVATVRAVAERLDRYER